MRADVNIKDYYLNYIDGAKAKLKDYKDYSNVINDKKIELHKYLTDNLVVFFEKFNLDLTEYKIEFECQTYNPSRSLYQQALKLIRNTKNTDNRQIIIQLLKYCQTLEKEKTNNDNIELCEVKASMKQSDFTAIVRNFYKEVQKHVLKGNAYKFAYGLGTFIINYWILDKGNFRSKMVDMNATNQRRRQLLAEGRIPYNKEDAMRCKEQGIEYKGEPYVVYKNDSYLYEITFINSNVFRRRELEYSRNDYVWQKYKGIGFEELADKYLKTEEDVYNAPLDIRYKLIILLRKFPHKYLNFIRNAESRKYEC